MATYTRGEFLGMSAALVGAAGLGVRPGSTVDAAQAAGPGATADLALINGRVYTMDPAQPRAEAFAVRDGTIIAVGSTADIRNLISSGTEVIDAEGMTVTPGFIDAHCHPATGGSRELVQVNLDLRSIEEIVVAVRDKAATMPSEEHWIDGFKYDDTKVIDGRRINRFDLDEAAPDNPVRVSHRGGHIAWYNSKALQMAGVTRETPDPQGGRFEHSADGELTGLVEERANGAFNGVGVREETTRDDQRRGVELITELMTAAGLTSVHDASTSSDSARAYQDALQNGQLRCRITMLVRGGLFEAAKAGGLYTGFGNEWVRIGPVKFGADGSASGRTMYMSTPYVGTDDHGILTMTPEEIHEAVEDAHRHDFQIGIHANGDKTIEYVLDAYERVLRMWPHPDRRHRLEHCSLVNPDLLTRIKASGSIPTPFWTYAHYHGNKWVEYGQEKMEWMFAHKSFLDYDIPVAGASDYVPGPFEPLMAIQSMVTRKDFEGRVWGPSQKVTVDEALRIGTVNGAYASYEEDVKGSIAVGKYADFVELRQDPHDVDPDAIKEIEVARTVVGGRTMHPKGA
ncbi:MAG: amidohydrolase [Vicinamibacterales bacterium]|jgi:hypothetical protein|nr:amidohydrolase [Vicinamibacterales bacterium]MDP6610014.1 amidohydrolase [Vicinamibacterales bacterium]|tara:strand:+ start:7302 stop:9011 length:1710 start_codon:yes stop_codon:yes gene_type:complete